MLAVFELRLRLLQQNLLRLKVKLDRGNTAWRRDILRPLPNESRKLAMR
jgi:hypothetical protein